MKQSNAPSAASFHHRRNARVMVTPKGEVLANTPVAAPELRTQVKWEASVVDVTSNTPVPGYPTLEGEDTISIGGEHGELDIVPKYLLQLRFVDGEKPDVAALTEKLNLGIWEVAIVIHSSQPL